MRKATLLVSLVMLGITVLHAEDRPEFLVPRALEAPKTDGSLEDEIWKEPPLTLGDWVSYNPLRGEKSTFRTDVRVAYDERNLYFAFHCYDPEPERIAIHTMQRDGDQQARQCLQ